ncbi:iripin-1-like [Haemaphysalis longicornis]
MKSVIWLSWLLAICIAQEEHKVTDASNQFGFRLLQKIPASSEVNLFFSPYSVSTALAMAYVGARADTQQELHESLGYSSVGLTPDHVPTAHAQHTHVLRAPSNSTLRVANAAVLQERYNVLTEYLDLLTQSFAAEVSKANLADEQSRKNINTWVKNSTGGKIEDLLREPLPPNTKMVLLNAIYFKGLWDTPFDASFTSSTPFYNGGTEQVTVDMMRNEVRVPYAYHEATDADVADLPYAGLDYSMTIVLPRDRSGAEALRQRLSWPVFQNMLSHLQQQRLTLALPRFKLEGAYKLKQPISQLGAKKMFDERQADLSGITGSRDLFVHDVIHKAVVEVNEEGSEAAGASGVVFVTKSLSTSTRFIVDHPFLFFIRNTKTGDVFFAGQVNHL